MDIKKILSLANLTPQEISFDEGDEKYILTAEEETEAIRHEIERYAKYVKWKISFRPLPEEDKKFKLEQMDFASAINREEILKRANSNKLYAIWQKEQREKEELERKAKIEETKKVWTARQMLHFMRWTSKEKHGKVLIENENTMPLIKALCFFLSEDQRFEAELGFSLKKGLIIRGISGLGKTYTVSCVAENLLNPIHIVSMIEIADDVRMNGEYRLNGVFKKLYLDDVGSEEATVNHYGTKINWFKDYLELFYLRSHQYNRLIFSTNSTANDIQEKYGFRVRSRIKDMFNIIDVTGIDLRGQ